MHIFYHPDHVKHDPANLHKTDTPQHNQILCEIAQRGRILHDAIRQANLGNITPPGNFGAEPIDLIHEYGMLNLLQDAYDRVKTEFGLDVALPHAFIIDKKPPRKSRSLYGQLGAYVYDLRSPILKHTWEAAYWSAQTALSAAALVSVGNEKFTYALCRPPGHHAGANYFGGHCYLNNAAITANWLVQQGRRVAVLDIGCHHANGTQDIFYHRSDVLVCSLHADPLYEYPYYSGYADEFGANRGLSYNFNFPLPRGVTERPYLDALAEALKKVQLYVPDTLVLSLGFDTLDGDPMGSFKLEPESFFQIGKMIQSLGIPVITVQEGGYLLSALGESVVRFFQGLTNTTATTNQNHDNS
jgi:acetoin utilization deacetylase AcuC-like enzyme